MSYRERTRQTVELPSGAKVTIRKLCGSDFLGVGNIPVALTVAAKANGEHSPSQAHIEYGVKLSTIMLTRCCGPIQFEGESLRIVNKPFAETGTGEISIEELEQADAEAIVQAITKFSGLGKEAAAAARPFPDGPEAARAPASNGESVSVPTEHAAEVATG